VAAAEKIYWYNYLVSLIIMVYPIKHINERTRTLMGDTKYICDIFWEK